MSDIATLEARVATLESKVEGLLRTDRSKDWRDSLGMFAGDELMKEIDDAGREIREADREATIQALGSH